ncbi:MAG: zf-HC2 domain-containing protein [Pseudomonadales bacterium]
MHEILPWFVNNSLEGRQKARVVRHLQQCQECRQERDRLQHQQYEIAGHAEDLPDYRFSYGKLIARIEAAEENREHTETIPPAMSRRTWISVAGAAAVLILGVYIVGSMPQLTEPVEPADFLTLTLPVEDHAGSKHRVALTFGDGVSARVVREALIEARSRLVDGPDETGAYILDVMVPENVSEDTFIESLQKIDGIAKVAFLKDAGSEDKALEDKYDEDSNSTR